MPRQITDDELLRRKRALRLRIGRSRRRIDGRFHAVEKQTRHLLSWRTYATRYPGWSVAAALGVGWAISAGLRPARVSRWLGLSLARQATQGIQRQLWNELQWIWNASSKDDET